MNATLVSEFDIAGREARRIAEGDAAKVFDLSAEPSALRDEYGRNDIGQTMLAARRLVEYGVPYVTVNLSGWDSHKRHFETMKRKSGETDTAVATLLKDLKGKGLLDSTIVWMGGEFGRTPKVGWEAPWNGGRNHYPRCFSTLVAGGGFKGGCVVGESDETASVPVSRPVSPQDFIGSIYELCGHFLIDLFDPALQGQILAEPDQSEDQGEGGEVEQKALHAVLHPAGHVGDGQHGPGEEQEVGDGALEQTPVRRPHQGRGSAGCPQDAAEQGLQRHGPQFGDGRNNTCGNGSFI